MAPFEDARRRGEIAGYYGRPDGLSFSLTYVLRDGAVASWVARAVASELEARGFHARVEEGKVETGWSVRGLILGTRYLRPEGDPGPLAGAPEGRPHGAGALLRARR